MAKPLQPLWIWQISLSALVVVAYAGCRSPWPCNQRHVVSSELQSRLGSELGPGCGLTGGSIPESVNFDDGITESEAVALAFWNNAAYHELLAQLGISRSQLFNAGLISDPQFVLFFPVGPKQLELTGSQSVDAIWLRPIRLRAAQLDLDELARSMIQNGLNLARDARLAHVNLILAQNRAELTTKALELRKDIQSLAEKRLKSGDISELEVIATRIDALQATAVAANAAQDVMVAREQLRVLTGLPAPTDQFVAVAESFSTTPPDDDKETLVDLAHAMRPDLRAIEIRKAGAMERARLARKQFMNLDAIFDANSKGTKGFESGPGLRFTLPIFNGNRGGIAVADAIVNQVDKQYSTLKDQIEWEVRTAQVQLGQALEQRELIETRILPALAEAQELARKNYEDGGVAYFLVLQTTSQYVDAQLRREEASAAIRRAHVQLERSIGRCLRNPSS
jgi:outer membrane protein, heavy metal efflux system